MVRSDKHTAPPASAATKLILAALSTRRHFRNPKTCAARIIKPMLSHLGAITPTDIQVALEGPPHFAELLIARSQAKAALLENCRRCGLCGMAQGHG